MTIKRINEEFYDLIEMNRLSGEGNPYDVDWNQYDALTPGEAEARNYAVNVRVFDWHM